MTLTGVGVTGHFLIGLEATPRKGIHVWYCISDQKPMTGELRGPKREAAIVGLLNAHGSKLSSKSLYITYRLVLLSALEKPLFAVSDG